MCWVLLLRVLLLVLVFIFVLSLFVFCLGCIGMRMFDFWWLIWTIWICCRFVVTGWVVIVCLWVFSLLFWYLVCVYFVFVGDLILWCCGALILVLMLVWRSLMFIVSLCLVCLFALWIFNWCFWVVWFWYCVWDLFTV